MSTISMITLVGVMLVLAAIPSAGVALVVTRSATLGIRNGISVTLGIVAGDLIFVTLAIFGMSFLAETMGSFFAVLRYAGGAYLIWLGVALLRSGKNLNLRESSSSKVDLSASFLSGLLLTLGDIKAILFYASLFPAFVDMASLNVADIAGIVSATILAVGGVKTLYAIEAQRIAARLNNPNAQNLVRRSAGCCMIGAGTLIITKA